MTIGMLYDYPQFTDTVIKWLNHEFGDEKSIHFYKDIIEHSLNDNAINNNLATYGDALLKLALCDILFDEKVENIALWIKNLNAEAEAVKKEKNTLAARQKAYEALKNKQGYKKPGSQKK